LLPPNVTASVLNLGGRPEWAFDEPSTSVVLGRIAIGNPQDIVDIPQDSYRYPAFKTPFLVDSDRYLAPGRRDIYDILRDTQSPTLLHLYPRSR
jgi:hypothetical protein